MKIQLLKKFSQNDINKLSLGLSDLYEIKPYNIEEFSNPEKIDVCLGWQITEEFLKQAKRLKLLAVPGAGVDRLDLKLLKEYSIKIINSHSNAKYVAEFSVTMALNLVKKINFYDSVFRQGKRFFDKSSVNESNYLSDTLFNKKIGIIGFGNIGQNIAKLLLPYTEEIFFTNRSTENKSDISFVKYLDLPDLIKNCDLIFLAIPLTPFTKYLIGKNEFANMGSDTYLINVSRSDIIEEQSLYFALRDRKIKGFGSDVWYSNKTGFPSDKFDFHKFDNILLSPYRSSYVQNYSYHLDDIIKTLRKFALTGKLSNEIDYARGY